MTLEIRLYCDGRAWKVFKYGMDSLGKGCAPVVSAGKEKNHPI